MIVVWFVPVMDLVQSQDVKAVVTLLVVEPAVVSRVATHLIVLVISSRFFTKAHIFNCNEKF